MVLLKYIVVYTTLMCYGSAYKILAVFPYQAKSHFTVFESMLKQLAKREHHVTVISHFPQTTAIRNYKDISLKGTMDLWIESIPLSSEKPSIIQHYKGSQIVKNFALTACMSILSSKVLEEFLDRQESYDIVLMEFFASSCFMGLMERIKAHLIGFTSSEPLPWSLDYFGPHENPAYIPMVQSGFTKNMNFFQRVENTFRYIYDMFIYKYQIVDVTDGIAQKHIGTKKSTEDYAYQASLLLLNTHVSLNTPRPLAPNIIPVGGIHLDKVKDLPVNLEKWINESPKGVIYFSMGSMIKGHTFPEEKRRAFLKAFARLDQRVLWKWENETMPEKPDNVMIQKWMPQFDILCHPNVKGFISHGGLLGTTETVHCGVPAVVMPQFGDQHTNARALEASGGGIVLDFHSITEDSVYNALKTILDPEFNKKAKELSARFRDRPMPPLETAIYWIEYVARHKGAHHLKTAAVGMPLYQYLLLDVAAFFIAVISLIFYIFYRLVKLCFRKKSKNNSKKTQ